MTEENRQLPLCLVLIKTRYLMTVNGRDYAAAVSARLAVDQDRFGSGLHHLNKLLSDVMCHHCRSRHLEVYMLDTEAFRSGDLFVIPCRFVVFPAKVNNSLYAEAIGIVLKLGSRGLR